MTRYTCCDDLRRNEVDAHPTLNGIDYLEVLDRDAPAGSPRQRTLFVRCLKPVPALTADNVRVMGGERVRDIRVEWVASASTPPAALTTAAEQALFVGLPNADHVLVIRTSAYGDYSPYVARLQRTPDDARAPIGFDPRLVEVGFSFKVECPSEFDCQPARDCPELPRPSPAIDYLAKDYASFRRVMLDRVSQLIPAWSTRTPADLGVTLVELLAYAGDHLSYWQDAVATEAYLDTARRRTSLRRHALLVDYVPHEGSNARAWLQLVLAEGVPSATIPLAGLQFFSRVPRALPRIPADPFAIEHRDALAARPIVFEPLDPSGHARLDAAAEVTLWAEHHEIPFYAWGNRRCCLPVGATSVTLAGHFEHLRVGDVLIFEEVKGPDTGAPGDADPAHRHAVRLATIDRFDVDTDPPEPLRDPLTSALVTEIAWARTDALPFPLCLSSRTDREHGEECLDRVSVARGNIILADHGATIGSESLGAVPPARLTRLRPSDDDRCDPGPAEPLPARFRPSLSVRPLTHAATVERLTRSAPGGPMVRTRLAFNPDAPAVEAFRWRTADVLPVVVLQSTVTSGGSPVTEAWEVRRDLLNSADEDSHVVVESEHDGEAFLRFGDDHHGRRPESGTAFVASYRAGQGLAGNVGSDAIAHVVTDDVRLAAVRNPLSASGGTEPESAEQIRRRAPEAFRTQERAVTTEDYAAVTGRIADVQRAAATQRWTGSWHTMFVTVDREDGTPMDTAYRADAEAFVEPYRMAGHDLAFNDPVYVPLELHVTICVAQDYFRSDVHAALLEVLSNRALSDGRRGIFHPDAFTFGQAVYVSPIYAAIRSVPGVEMAEITRFARQGRTFDPRPLQMGVMNLGRLEIARLDNDRNFPERGALRLSLHGGK